MGPSFKLRDSPRGAYDLCPAGLPVTQFSFGNAVRRRPGLHR